MKLKNLLFFSLIIFSNQAYSQMGGSWVSAQLEIDLPKGFVFEVTEESRIYNYSGFFVDQWITDLELGYKINSRFDASILYRFAKKNEDREFFYSRHRFAINLNYDNNWNRFGFDYRIRYLTQNRSYVTDAFDAIPDHYIRNKIKVSYNINNSPLEPYVSYEIFNPLNRYKPKKIDEYRLVAGVDIPLSDNQAIDVGIMFNQELDDISKSIIVLLLGYTFELN